jgi:hypothetical protein
MDGPPTSLSAIVVRPATLRGIRPVLLTILVLDQNRVKHDGSGRQPSIIGVFLDLGLNPRLMWGQVVGL